MNRYDQNHTSRQRNSRINKTSLTMEHVTMKKVMKKVMKPAMKLSFLMGLLLILHLYPVFSAENHTHHSNNNAGSMRIPSAQLSEAGNDAFGTIQEVILKLTANPDTDWEKVNIEALRLHLLDMNDMTLNIEVISQKQLPRGLQVIVKATTDRAALALKTVFKAHPAQLKRETGWIMNVEKKSDTYILTTTSNSSKDINKIRALGYIGLMAYGSHHQPHHWAMASGKNPHDSHQ